MHEHRGDLPTYDYRSKTLPKNPLPLLWWVNGIVLHFWWFRVLVKLARHKKGTLTGMGLLGRLAIAPTQAGEPYSGKPCKAHP